MIIGIDPHKMSHTASAVDPATNSTAASLRIDASLVGYRELMRWAKQFPERRWAVAFAFGLIHGFGFASVLADLGLPQGTLLLALVGFNLGVETGQLAIVCAFLPLAYALRGSWFYRHLVFRGGSAAIALIASVWLVERVFDLKLL